MGKVRIAAFACLLLALGFAGCIGYGFKTPDEASDNIFDDMLKCDVKTFSDADGGVFEDWRKSVGEEDEHGQ